MTSSELRQAAQDVLQNNILRFWQTRMVDTKQGGFYGRIDGQNTLHPDAPKGAVLNARILWTFASAARVLHNTPYRILAARAYDYLMQRFIDREQGGVYWSLNADGTPLDTKKQTYAIAFAIYSLAEYVRLTDNQEALEAAIRLFDDIEAHAFDAVNIGYVEALTRDWQPIADMRLSEHDENGSRTMNTHLHVLEAYTNLYRVLKVQGNNVQCTKERVEQQLRTLIDIFVNRIYNPENGHLDLFFDDEWNGRRDKHSPGHDIEAAWLLHEALDVLGDKELLNRTLLVIHSLAQAAEDSVGVPRRKRPLSGSVCDGESVAQHGALNERRARSRASVDASDSQWWCYAEAVVGYIDQWQLLAENPKSKIESEINWQLAEAAYEFISTHLLDREHGEWYWSVLPDGTPDTDNDKAGFWKCPYHNSRMCLEIIERLNK